MSFAHPIQLTLAMEAAQSFAIDNGAFSAWKTANPVTDWSGYYRWVGDMVNCPTFDFAVIPDVIDGTEEENDALINEWPWGLSGAPVWHLNESLERLEQLANTWPRVCLGSSGEYADIGTIAWWQRMGQALDAICDGNGYPVCKLHGLRMLNPEVFTRLPFASADSTNIARNIGVDSAWRGTYQPPNKEARAWLMRERIESQQAALTWERRARPIQHDLLEAI